MTIGITTASSTSDTVRTTNLAATGSDAGSREAMAVTGADTTNDEWAVTRD
jgi:hypothetical protein